MISGIVMMILFAPRATPVEAAEREVLSKPVQKPPTDEEQRQLEIRIKENHYLESLLPNEPIFHKE